MSSIGTALMLLLPAGAGDPAADAGNAYRQALEALEAQKYEEAVKLVQAALQKVGEENESLKYRDSVARHRHAYYPYYQWARARLLQAKRESSIFARRDLLQDAIGRLGQTRHPDAARILEEAKADLASAEEAIALDGSFNAVKTRIEVLGNGERFVEALRQLEDAASRYRTRDREIGELREALKEKQTAVVRRYEQLMAQRLGEVVVSDPLAGAERILPLVQPALIPSEVTDKPGPTFVWLRKFTELWEQRAGAVRRSATLPGAELNAAAESLEAAALEALAADLSPGFRATRHIAHVARLAKLREIASGSEDVIDLATAGAVVRSALDGAARASEAMAARPPREDIRVTLENDLASQKQQVEDLRRRIEEASKERIRLTAPILQAEEALKDGSLIGDAAALTKLRNDLLELGSEANFGTLTTRLRARALFAHAIAEAILGFLEGNTPTQVVARCRLPAWRAYGFDPSVETRWAPRLSPKMMDVFKQIKPQ
jgi:hypothetical protein